MKSDESKSVGAPIEVLVPRPLQDLSGSIQFQDGWDEAQAVAGAVQGPAIEDRAEPRCYPIDDVVDFVMAGPPRAEIKRAIIEHAADVAACACMPLLEENALLQMAAMKART